MDETPSVVVVGAASRDLVDDDPRGWRLGGGVSYSALTLAKLGLRVGALVGADALAARAAELDLLRIAGVEVVIAPLEHGPVFVNHETPDGRIQHTPEVSDPVRPSALPAGWRDAQAWLFGPVAAGARCVGGRARGGCPGRPRVAGPAADAADRGTGDPPASERVADRPAGGPDRRRQRRPRSGDPPRRPGRELRPRRCC
jgi:hypothetical protein